MHDRLAGTLRSARRAHRGKLLRPLHETSMDLLAFDPFAMTRVFRARC